MKLFGKILALALAFMLAVGCFGAAFAEPIEPDQDGNIETENLEGSYEYDGDLAGLVRITDVGDVSTELTITGDVDNEKESGVTMNVHEGGSVSVETGDITTPTDHDTGLGVDMTGEDSEAKASVGDITSGWDGVEAWTAGGTVEFETGDVNATNTGVIADSTKLIEEVPDTAISVEDFSALNAKYVEYVRGNPVYETESGETYGRFFDWEAEDYYYARCTVTEPEGNTQITVDGDVNVESTEYETYGVKALNESPATGIEIDVTGDVNVSAEKDEGYTGGVVASSEGGEAVINVEGTVTVKGDGEYNSTTGAVATVGGEESVAEVTVGDGIVVDAGTDEGAYGYGVSVYADEGTAAVTVTGDISVSGEYAQGISVNATKDGTAEISVTGDITAEAEELAQGVHAENYGGTIDIDVNGDITSENHGIVLIDTTYVSSLNKKDYPAFSQDEFLYTEEGGNGGGDLYCHEEDGKKIYYNAYNGEVYQAWENVSHDPGTTSVTVVGDVTAEETGVYMDLTNDKSKMDVIVDGTLSGETQSVLVSEDTVLDNLTLTVWEIKANDEGNVAERETADGKTEADRELEKKIQYIIKIEPTQLDLITAQGTSDYEGYKVAKEGDTVTLKVNIPAGYSLKNAFNGTDTKVQLLQDASGDYYLVVPKGGAVMLSVELEKIAEAPKQTDTVTPAVTVKTNADTAVEKEDAKVAAMKETADTAETEAMMTMINEAAGSGDVLSVLADDVKAMIPEGISKLAEAITMTLENYEAGMGAVILRVTPVKKQFTKGEKATVVIILPDGNGGYSFFYIEGEGTEDGTLSLNISAAIAKALAGMTFTTMILE